MEYKTQKGNRRNFSWGNNPAEERDVTRGYFGIGIVYPKSDVNIGTLWRSAYQMGASFVFTVGKKYEPQASDTPKAWRNLPLYHYSFWMDFQGHIPYDCQLIGVEIGGRVLKNFVHPERGIYLLGSEGNGLSEDIQKQCHTVVELPFERMAVYNVAVAGSLIMFDRMIK